MAERFRKANKAAGYVREGLMHDWPDCTATVVGVFGTRLKEEACPLSGIEDALNAMCKGFDSAIVDYHPNNAYGFVAEICENHGSESSDDVELPENGDAPRIYVIVHEVKGRPIAVGSRPQARSGLDFDFDAEIEF